MEPTGHRFDTSRSDALAAAFARRDFKARRRVITFTRTVGAGPAAVFRQLCPTRERDWIDGWDCELIYTESGFGEDRCVFRTGEGSVTGPGLWTFSHVEEPRLLKIVRVMPPFLQHLDIELEDNGDGTTDTRWTVTVTALDAEGNALLETLPADDEVFAASAEALVHFFATGRMLPRGEDGGGRAHGHGPEPVHGFLAAAARRVRGHRGHLA